MSTMNALSVDKSEHLETPRWMQRVESDRRIEKMNSLTFVPLERSIERQSLRYIVKCLTELQLHYLPLPLPVDVWIERPLGIQLEFADLSRFDTKMSHALGSADVTARIIEIDQRIAEQSNRFRFTVAHELGHIALHSDIEPHETLVYEQNARKERYERQADRFAASFLMPVSAFRQECERILQRGDASAAQMLSAVSRGEADATKWFLTSAIPSLARRFGVARTAALNRFRDLRVGGGKPAIPLKTLQLMHKRLSSMEFF